MFLPTRIKKIVKTLVIVFLGVSILSASFPIVQLAEKLSESKIVDTLYLSSQLNKVVDNFGVKTAKANPGTRVRTVEFFAGQLYSSTGVNVGVAQTFTANTVQIAESSVSIINAYVELSSEVGGTASLTSTEALINFDACTPTPCTPSVANFMNTAGLGATSAEAQMLRFRADVTAEGTLAAYTGGGSNFSFQVGYCFDGASGTDAATCNGTSAVNVQMTSAKLVVTYTYDDTSATQTNTVIYPLDSGTDIGSKTASQVLCTVDSNCPTFSYNAEIPEIGTQLSQFFYLQSSINTTTTTDFSTVSDIGGNPGGANTSAAVFEAALSNNGGWVNWIHSGVAGYANNSAQSLEISTNASAAYTMGGENYITYTYPNAAATKTKTVVYDVGEVQLTGSTTKSALKGPTVYFPESGVAIKKAWFRIQTSSSLATSTTLNITSKIGNNAESAARGYAFATDTVPVSNDGYFIYIIPSSGYTELQAATGSSGKLAQMTAQWVTTARGAVSAELVITYTYTGDSGGYNITQNLFAGQQTTAADAVSLSLGTVNPKIAEASDTVITGVSLVMNVKGAAFATADEQLDSNLGTSSCTATASTSTTITDDITELDRHGFFTSISGIVTTNDATTYIPCYDTSEAGIYGGRITITYKWAPVAATLTIGKTAGSVFVTRNSGDTSQYAHDTACAAAAACAAFTLLPSGSTVNLTSIKISEVGTAAANTDLSNGALFYDTNGNWADGEVETQYGSTAATFDLNQTATMSATLALTSGTTYYFYVRYDVKSTTPTYPKGGQTVSFSIAANGDVVSDGTETGAGQTLNGTQTVLPVTTGVTYAVGGDGGRSGAAPVISGFGFGVAPVGSRGNCAGAVDTGCVRFTVGGSTTVATGDVSAWSNTSITFSLIAGLASNGGASGLEVVAGSQGTPTDLTYYVYPTVGAISGASFSDGGYQDGTFTINGDHLDSSGAASNITVNGVVPSSIGVWSSTSVTLVDIPNTGTDSGTFTVTRASDSKASNASATFYIYPQITSYTSAQTDGDIQTGTITISGNHFGTGGVASDVTINTVASESLTWTSSSSLTSVAIPNTGADSGTVTVRNPQSTKTSNACGNATCSGGNFFIYPDVTGLTVCNKVTTPAWPADSGREYLAGDSACPNNLKDGHVILNGTHFGAAGTITIHGQTATQEVIATAPCTTDYSATCATIQIPTTIANTSYTGNIVLTRTAGSKADTYSGFRVLPRIASTGPVNLKGMRGDTGVSITGDHLCQSGTCPTAFSTTNKVSFTGADITSGASTWTDTSVPSITVPAAASDGALSVLSNTNYVSNNLTYDVKFKPDATAGGAYTGRAPANAATGISLNPTLTGVTFADGAGDSDSHILTEWNVAHNSDADWATPEWTRTSSGVETSIAVNTTNGTFANGDAGQTTLDCATYKWRYRYKDDGTVASAEWSDWTADWTFTTTGCGPDATSMSNSTEGALTDGGRIGQIIVLTGTNFGTVSAGSRATCGGGAGTGCIKVGGTGGNSIPDGNVTAWTNTSITFSLVSGVTSYGGATTNGVIVYGASVTDSDGLTFYVYPDITSLSVSEAREGDTITINGNHFGTAAGSLKVTIDAQTVSDCTWSETSLTGCTVPTAIADTNNSVTVRAYQGTGGNNSLFDDSTGFGILPRITGISAATYSDGGYQDGTFTISGSHLGASAGSIVINGAANDGAAPTWGVSSISGVGIPNTGTDSGTIIVTRTGDSKTSNSFSTFYIYPQITGFTAAQSDGDIQTATITVTGNHFGATQGTGDVTINTAAQDGTITWSSTSLTNVGIPNSGGDSGTITVTRGADSKTSNASSTFYIYPDIISLTVPTAVTDAAREHDVGDSDGVITINGTHLGAAGTVTVFGSSATQQTTGTCTGSAYQATCTGIQIPTAISNSTYTGNIVATRTSDSKIDTYTGFRILPRIITNTPSSGIVGDTIQLLGDHFCETGTCPVSPNRSTASDNIQFGSTQAPDADFVAATGGGGACDGAGAAWTHSEICVKVPSGTPSGSQPTKVTSNTYTSNQKSFTRSSTVPTDPSSLTQYRANGTTTIATDGISNETSVVLKMNMSAPVNATLVPEVEVKAIGAAFNGSTNITVGSGVAYTGTPVIGSVTVSGLTNLTEYHWQARVKNNATSEYSGWVGYGGNTENPPTNPAARDWKVDTSAPTISAVSAGTPGDISATITWTTAIASNSSINYSSSTSTHCLTGSTASDGASVTSHSVTLNNLAASTTYYYRVTSTDTASNTANDPVTVSTSADCRTFTTAAPIARLMKSTDFFIVQDTTTSVPNWTGGSAKNYDVFVSEYDASNTKSVTLRSAYVEVSGIAVSSATFSMQVKINSQTAITYNFPSTGGNPQPFTIVYDVTSLNYDYPGNATATNTLEISFPSAPTSVSGLNARQVFTYHYTP